MEGRCSTGQSPQWAVVPMEEDIKLVYTRHMYCTMDGQELLLVDERTQSHVITSQKTPVEMHVNNAFLINNSSIKLYSSFLVASSCQGTSPLFLTL